MTTNIGSTSTSSGLVPYIGLSNPWEELEGPTFSAGPPNLNANEGGTSTRGFRKLGRLKDILLNTLKPKSSLFALKGRKINKHD